MIDWLSEHDETSRTGSAGRFRIGKPLQAFWSDFEKNPEYWNARGYEIFETSAGKYIKQPIGILTEPPCARLPAPRPPSFLRDFQGPHFRSLWDIFSLSTAAGDFSDTGTGKTYVTVALALEMELPLFVVCLMAGIDKWKKVITEFGAKAICVGNYEYFKADNDYGALDVAYYPAKIFNAVLSKDGKGPGYCPFPRTKAFNDYAQCLDYLFSKSIVRKKQMEEWEADKGKSLRLLCREIRGYKWNLPRNTFMVFDEGHKCKSPDSQNMRLLAAAKGYVTEVLTATPGVSPRDFKATGYVLGLHRFYDFDLWTEGHGCRRVFTRGAKKKFIGWDYAKSSGGLELLNKELFPVRAARMRVSEIPGFPETMITAECFSAKEAPEIEKAYLTTVAYCKNAVKENQILQVTAILKYRMHAELLKVPLYAQLIEESIEGGFSVAMFVNFKDTLAALHKKFPEFPLIFGSQKQSEREAGRLRFEKNEVKGILLNSQAGGVSLDLHDVYQTNPRMALISPTYDPYVLKQVFGRVARDGGTKSFQRLIYVAGTQEEKVCESVRKKIKAFQVVNGDDITKEDLIEDVFSGIMKDEILEEVENE